jgi:hypothetical protein
MVIQILLIPVFAVGVIIGGAHNPDIIVADIFLFFYIWLLIYVFWVVSNFLVAKLTKKSGNQ